MQILVLPVSGGAFTNQLAIIKHLCELNYEPTITLASSGGNVAAYVACAAEWKWPAIERIAKQLNSSHFIKPHSSVGILAIIIGYFRGEVYDHGIGIEGFLKQKFKHIPITNYEIWTGTYNKERQKPRLFCNKGSSILDINSMDLDLLQTMPPYFCDGDIEKIAHACIASASIPGLVSPQIIEGEKYTDGGVAGASPLNLMQEPILKYVNHHKTDMHITYLNSINLSETVIGNSHNFFDTIKQAVSDVVRDKLVADRYCCYELLRYISDDITKEEFPCNYDNLKYVNEIRSKHKYSFLEIYATGTEGVNMLDFNHHTITVEMNKAYKSSYCRFWYI